MNKLKAEQRCKCMREREEFELSPETIEQKLQPVDREQRQTDLRRIKI